MILRFKKLNPCALLDKIIVSGIGFNTVTVISDCKQGEIIAENVTVNCLNEDVETIKSIAEKLDNNVQVITKTTLETRVEILENTINELILGGV